jgi:peptidase E
VNSRPLTTFLKNPTKMGLNPENIVLVGSERSCQGIVYFSSFSKVKTVLFIPYALHDHDNYATMAKGAFGNMGM